MVGSAIGAAALLAFAIVVVTGGDSDTSPREVSMVEFAFAPVDIVAEAGQDLHITNDGAIPHSLLIVGAGKGVELAPGQDMSLDLGGVDAGTYEVICDLPGHVDQGMVGTIRIG